MSTGGQGGAGRRGAGKLLVEPARPAVVREHPRAHWLVVATVCIGAFMGQLDASIVALAFPTLQRHFGASLAEVEWVALTYLVTLVAALAAVGRVSDMVGRKLVYVYGFVLFTLASVACGLSTNLLMLDAFRVVQALGAAMLQANSVALITAAMPRGMLGRGIGVQGAAQAVGLALGPTVGGLLIGLGGWRLIFFVNVPAGLLGIVLGVLLLPRTRDLAPRAPFDWIGLAMFAPAVSLLLYALSAASRHGVAVAHLLVMFVAAAALGAAFVLRQRRTPSPMLDPRLFRRLPFTAGVTAGLMSYLAMFGALFVTPFFLEAARHDSPAEAGLELSALPVALGLVAPFAGRLADRIGPRLPTVAGMLVAAGAFGAMALDHHGTALLVAELALLGAGLGAFTPANNAAIMASAPRAQAGLAGGVLNMTRGVGTALGVAATGLVFAVAAGRTAGASVDPSLARTGFQAALVFLAIVCVAAAGVAGLRSRTAPAH